MKIRYLYHKKVGDPRAAKMSKDDWIRRVAQENTATPKEREQFSTYLDIIASEGQYELDIPEDWEKADKDRVKALYKAVEKSYKLSLQYEDDIKQEKEDQKAESEKRGQQIVVGAAAGHAIAVKSAAHMVDGLDAAIKGKFVRDGMQMKLVKGAKPSEKDFSVALGILVNLKGAANEAADMAGFYMVDLIRLAGEANFDGDQLIEQIADEFGVTKFTAMQAQRIGEFWPAAKRIPGVSMTVHAEIMNYSGGVKDAKKLDAVIEKVKEGRVDEITTKDGKKVPTEKKNYSAKAVRAMMQEISGKTPPPPKGGKGGAGGTETANFIYITQDKEGIEVIYKHNDLSMAACESDEISVLDLMTMTRLDKKGQAKYPIKDLPDSWFPRPAPVVKPEKPAKSPKAEPKKEEAPAPTQIPD